MVFEFPNLLNSPNPLACRPCKLKVPAFFNSNSYVSVEPSMGVNASSIFKFVRFVFDALTMLKIIGVVVWSLLTLIVKEIGILEV